MFNALLWKEKFICMLGELKNNRLTHTDHTCAHVNLDLSEMGKTVQVQSTASKAFRFLLTGIMTFCLVGCLSLLFILVT